MKNINDLYYHRLSGQPLALTLLRMGLVFVFLYAAISGFISPENYVKWIPPFLYMLPNFNSLLFLRAFFSFEILLVLLVISKRWAATGALLMAFVLAAFTVFNLFSMDTLFRNVGLFFAALALFVLAREQYK